MTEWLNYTMTLMEELNSGLGVVLAILAMIGYGVALVLAWGRMGGRMDNVESAIQKSMEYHKAHFGEISELKTDVASLAQKLDSHVEEDRTQFGNITALLKENRDNTLDILKHLRNGAK